MQNEKNSEQLRHLVEAVRTSRKYRSVTGTLIARLGAEQLGRAHGFREAVKATRNKLHQIAGMYLDGEMRYAAWLEELRQALQSGDPALLRSLCRRIMARHISTRERLPLLDHFYARLLADLPVPQRILDLACGLHPLALPWMPFFEARPDYYAYDIYEDLAAFLKAFLELLRLSGRAAVCDIVEEPPAEEADLAFVLKVLPLLEQVEAGAGLRLLEQLRVRYLLVSFPTHSLSGGKRGMATTYEARFRQLIGDHRWRYERFLFPGELVFRIEK
jgi:16S rRNA (guanine(1405)-N(7))-methyltransferase